MMKEVVTYLQRFGIHSLVLPALLLVSCNLIEKKPIIPIGHYTTLDRNAGLKFRDKSHLTLVFNDFTLDARYQIIEREFSNEIRIIFEPEKDTLIAEFLVESDNSLYLKYYKSMKGITHQIDEIIDFYLNKEKEIASRNCSLIALDSIQPGEYFVHFENSLSLNNDECDTIFIMQPGLTKVSANIDLRNLNNINAIATNSERVSTCNSSPLDANYCIEIMGFNQLPRSTIESRFNEKLDGDVLMFNINKFGVLK